MTTHRRGRAAVRSHDLIHTRTGCPSVPRRAFLALVLEQMTPDERDACLDFLEGEARGDLNFAALREVRSCRRRED